MQNSLVCLFLAFYGHVALAAQFKDHSTDNEWNSTAISSLGSSGILSTDFVDQFFFDPSFAANSKSRNVAFQWLNLNVNYSKDLSKTVSDAKKLASDSGSSSGSSAAKTLESLQDLAGRRLMGQMNMTMLAMRMGNLTVIPYATGLVDGSIRVPDMPQFDILIDGYVGMGIGYAMPLGKKFQVGANIRPGYRVYKTMEKSVADFIPDDTVESESSSSSDNLEKIYMGTYMPVDLGVGFLAHKDLRLNLAIRNVAGAAPLSYGKDGAPPVYPMRISAGAKWTVLDKKNHVFNLGTELQDMVNLGSENGFWYRWQWSGQYLYQPSFRKEPIFGINTGLASGFPSVGVFLDLIVVKVLAATYLKETGYHIGQSPKRMFSFQAYSQLSF